MKPVNRISQLLILVVLFILIQSCGDEPELKCGCELESDSLENGVGLVNFNIDDNNYYLDNFTQQLLICNNDLLQTLSLDIDNQVIYSGYIDQSCESNDTAGVITLTSIDPKNGCESPVLGKFETVEGKLFKNTQSYIPYDYYISAYRETEWNEWILFICNNSTILEMDIPDYPESIDVEFTGDVKYIESAYYDFGSYEHRLINIDEIEEVE